MISLLVANYGVQSNSFTQQGLSDRFSINIGRAIFPSNNVFCGDNYPYTINLQPGTNKKYIVIHYDPIYSNYQKNKDK
jgi:hypothetical protein